MPRPARLNEMKQLTIDERIEKLVDRHEALTQTVELLAHEVIRQGERPEKQGEHTDRILPAISQDGENIRALANIAQAHQASIDGLERRMG